MKTLLNIIISTPKKFEISRFLLFWFMSKTSIFYIYTVAIRGVNMQAEFMEASFPPCSIPTRFLFMTQAHRYLRDFTVVRRAGGSRTAPTRTPSKFKSPECFNESKYGFQTPIYRSHSIWTCSKLRNSMMNKKILIISSFLLMFFIFGSISSAEAAGKDASNFEEMSPGNKAVLIGCTTYTNMKEDRWLKGPENDLNLMKDFLIEKPNSFPEENIIILKENGGKDYRPTRNNIEKSMLYLSQNAKKGDFVVFYFAGHGSQIPDQHPPDKNDPEPDGLDEVLLPADAGYWDPKTKTLKNAIIDDQLGIWLEFICKKGANLWVIIDACHSGTVVRAGVDEVYRKIDPVDLGVPRNTMDRIEKQRPFRGGVFVDNWRKIHPPEFEERIPELAAIYAALPNEPTPELAPPGSDGSKVYGLFTYTLYNILKTSFGPLSYNQLAQRIRSRYVAWGRYYPTPIAEGRDLHKIILGVKEMDRRPRILLTKKNGKLKINAGMLYGLHPGSVLAVYPPYGARLPGKLLGYVRVVKDMTDPFEAGVEPCEYDGTAAYMNPPIGGVCKPVFMNFGDWTLRVAVTEDREDSSKRDAEPLDSHDNLKNHITGVLRSIQGEDGSLIRMVHDPEPGDWILRIRGESVELMPSLGFVKENTSYSSSPVFGPVPTGDATAPWLKNRLRRIARAKNLLTLANRFEGEMDLDIEIVLLRYDGKTDPEGKEVPRSDPIVLREKDTIAFMVKSSHPKPIDVTILFIDSGFGIQTVFPRRFEMMNNRLKNGGFIRSDKMVVNTRTTGLEHIVVIAVEAEGAPMNFGFLEQPTIEQVRNLPAMRGEGALNSPLGRLLQYAQYREGETRGLTRAEFRNHAFASLSWVVADIDSDDK